ncbi:MAG: NEW3 domain-containing protein [Candidatus Bathyarchaeia archaeon]
MVPLNASEIVWRKSANAKIFFKKNLTLGIILLLLAALLGTLTPSVVAGSVWTRFNSAVAKAGDTVSFDISLKADNGTLMDGWSGDVYNLKVTGLPSGWTARFYFGNVEITSINIKLGETVTVRLDVITSSDTAPGDYCVTFLADSSFTGCLSLPLTVIIRPPVRKITITPVYPCVQLEQGKSASMLITISNEGTCGEQLNLNAIMPQGWRGAFKASSEAGEVKLSTIYLSAGSVKSLIFEATPTWDYEIGEHFFILSVASVDSIVQASCSLKINVTPRTHPLLSCQLPMKAVQPGETARFQVSLSNPIPTEQTFSISVDSVPMGWNAKIKTSGGENMQVINAYAGETVTLTVEVCTPTNANNGTYPIFLTAKSTWILENLTLWVTVQSPSAVIELKAVPPYLDIFGGSDAQFKIQASNIGRLDELLNLTAEGLPSDFKVIFKDSAGKQIKAIYVEAGQLKDFYVVVSTPIGQKLGARNFTVYAFNAELREKVDLTVNILGFYKVELTNQNFYTATNVGGEATYILYTKNTGNVDVTNVKVAAAGLIPDGFIISISPSSIQSLGINQQASFLIEIKTESDVNAGNYYVNFQVTSDQTDSLLFTLRVEVFQTTNWILYALVIFIVAVIVLLIIYRKFGRR